jgi:chemotaxis protein CheX
MNASAGIAAEKWAPLLEHSIHEVFEIMLHSTLDPGKPAPADGIEFTAMVGLAGLITGVLTLRCGYDAANQIASAMLDVSAAEAGAHAWDAMGELANMVAGNFKNKIDGVSNRCLLSVPTVITGADYSFKSVSGSEPIELWFRFKRQPLRLSLEIHG